MRGPVHDWRRSLASGFGFVCACFVCAIIGTPVAAQSSRDLRLALDRLVGHWEGEASIHTLDGREIGHYPFRRVYTWSGDVMELESTLLMGGSEHTVQGRYFIRLGRLYATVSRPGQPTQDYTGESAQGGVFWRSALRDNRDLTEGVMADADGPHLVFDSFEVLGLEDLPGVVRIQGRLGAVRDSVASVDSAHETVRGTEWISPSDPVDRLRAYAPKPAESESN